MLLKTIWARLENKLVILAPPGKQLAMWLFSLLQGEGCSLKELSYLYSCISWIAKLFSFLVNKLKIKLLVVTLTNASVLWDLFLITFAKLLSQKEI